VRKFGELEATIMDLLWSGSGPATVREVLEELQWRRPIAYTTVMTVMDNLHSKGCLARESRGRAYLYRPVSTRAEYSADLMREALAESKNRTGTLLHFLDRMTPAESRALRTAMNKRRRG